MTLIRTGAWLAVSAIIVLSVVPGYMRPHVTADDHSEHFFAYFIAAVLLTIGHSRPAQLLSSGIVLAMCAGGLEIAQFWIPGRHSSIGDFATSALGVFIGLLPMYFFRRTRDRIAKG